MHFNKENTIFKKIPGVLYLPLFSTIPKAQSEPPKSCADYRDCQIPLKVREHPLIKKNKIKIERFTITYRAIKVRSEFKARTLCSPRVTAIVCY